MENQHAGWRCLPHATHSWCQCKFHNLYLHIFIRLKKKFKLSSSQTYFHIPTVLFVIHLNYPTIICMKPVQTEVRFIYTAVLWSMFEVLDFFFLAHPSV